MKYKHKYNLTLKLKSNFFYNLNLTNQIKFSNTNVKSVSLKVNDTLH